MLNVFRQTSECSSDISVNPIIHYVIYFSDILVRQLTPVYPGAHLQVYPFTASVHVPPFLHGFFAQSFMSTTCAIVSDKNNTF